ncbi:MAG: Mannosylfructose-phosphate synthase [candidate division WS2 bacterium ADurb.Bin280]|uniref:Mannosylfructose-phosphate synthase n=1 Tax=candidate division WS2 bacterium ADurb.Bin280 TaxID=1852829 RepID=A0A1V5SFA9_9BACT|nr:MAG: Mannosylfructose-phosphate synthase [candidate division WS2 bacterium ADurb.Bin280]
MKKTVIGIDASRSNTAQRTGTEYYSYEIIKQMISLKRESVELRLYSKTPLDYVDKNQKGVSNRVMSFPKLWSQIRLSFEILRNPPDVLFVPAHTIPVFHGKKTVITLHDVGFKYYPELYTPLERIYHDWCMRFSVKHANQIIAISEATKKDLIKLYGADERKITVVYHGYDKKKYFVKKEPDHPKIKPLGKYIYFIGRLEAKKNITTLIKAFALLKQNRSINHKLVLAGRPGYQYEQISDLIASLDDFIKKDIIELGYVSDEDAPLFMRNADIFAFPSNFEGFGMPLVEAMASGVPVVASNTTSIPEILNGAGLLHSVHDHKQLSDMLLQLIGDKKSHDKYVKLGLLRSSVFKWDDAASKTLDVIERLGSS